MVCDIHPMVGNLLAAKVATISCQTGDLCAGTRMARSDGRLTSGSAEMSVFSRRISMRTLAYLFAFLHLANDRRAAVFISLLDNQIVA